MTCLHKYSVILNYFLSAGFEFTVWRMNQILQGWFNALVTFVLHFLLFLYVTILQCSVFHISKSSFWQAPHHPGDQTSWTCFQLYLMTTKYKSNPIQAIRIGSTSTHDMTRHDNYLSNYVCWEGVVLCIWEWQTRKHIKAFHYRRKYS